LAAAAAAAASEDDEGLGEGFGEHEIGVCGLLGLRMTRLCFILLGFFTKATWSEFLTLLAVRLGIL
jgi:hypothetical protein